MKRILSKIGSFFAAMSTMIVSTATWGVCGEVEPPECLK